MKRLFIIIVTAVFCLHSPKAQSLRINEVCYANRVAVTDFEGDSPDWFELFNSSDHDINTAGYKLTDDLNKSFYWEMPGFILKPYSFILIFASGKDTAVNSEFHTSFRLSGLKESLYLINPEGEIIDKIDPVCVPANHSFSRIPDGNENLLVSTSTPRQTNNNAALLPVNFIADTLKVNNKGGFYSDPFLVTLSSEHQENKIMYTLNGDEPDERSAEYNEPLLMTDLTHSMNRFANIPDFEYEPGNEIFKANILRAVVYSNGCPASNEITATYFVNESIKGRYGIPVISLITEKDNLFDEEIGIYVHGKYRNFDQHGSKWERDVHVEIFDQQGMAVIDQDGGMRIHGRGSRRSPQKSLRLYADPEYGKEYFEYPLFSQKPGLNKFKVLLLRTTGGTLGPLFKEELCNTLVEDMNIDYNAGETAILFINGEYWGIYNLMERQNRDYLVENYQISDTAIDIVAYDRHLIVEDGSIEEYNNLISFLKSSDPAGENFFEEISEKIDIDGLIDYFTAQLYFANTDWPASNIEMWKLKNDTARWRYFFFDSDASMIWVNGDHITEHTNDIPDYQRFDDFCTLILEMLLKNDTFRNRFVTRFYEHMNTTFRTDHVTEVIDRFEEKYSPIVPEHIYRWHNPEDYIHWRDHVSALRTFAMARPLFLSEQLERNFGSPMLIYPNPATAAFTIRLANPADKAFVSVCSLSGVLLREWSFQHIQENLINIENDLSPGFYIINVITDSHRYSGKLIIQ